MNPAFVHLRVHSEYSLSDGLVRIKPLLASCAEQKMPAVAVTDRNNFFALVKFYNAAEQAGVKAVVASDVWVVGDNSNEPVTPLVLIARTDVGYQNLCQLLSRSYMEGQSRGCPSLKRDWIAERAEGLLALSGGREGAIGKALLAGNLGAAEQIVLNWQQIFPEAFYLELHRTGHNGEQEYNYQAVQLAIAMNCPIVATNDVQFLSKEDFEAHEVRVCIHDNRTLNDTGRERRYTDQQYLKSAAEMCELFEDLPEALENTLEIAKRCNVTLNLGSNYLPEYPVPQNETDTATAESFLNQVARQGLEERLNKRLTMGPSPGTPDLPEPSPDETRQVYEARLNYELDIINAMGFPGYFLIVMEFIQWAKDRGIPVGPGRGSGPSSLVAWSLKITDIDPIEHDLLFERFLNPERVSLPDFDVDFCMERREEVIQHVADLYGRDAVSQIITFGTMAAKAVVRDVARVQAKPHWLADKLAKLIPIDPNITLERALKEEPELADLRAQDDDADEIIDMALKLEGLVRNVSKHAGGVVIAPTRLTNFSPVYCDEAGGNLMTQFDMTDIEQVGLVKFDFLGLRTLTVIQYAVKSINRRRQVAGEALVDIEHIELEDAAVYKDLQQARTTAVFQLESTGMKELMKKVKPVRFADIVALVALYRPGPMKLADNFIKRRNGSAEVDYLHPSLKPILEDTYGVMLYQEQVMQIAQVLAGYTLADADLLRRAMGKKKPEEMAQQREVFLAGAKRNGVPERRAGHIFNLMEDFAGYGFNKPHSVAYALVAYQTAWLKHYYPADFMAATLSADLQNTDKVVTNIEECREIGLSVLSPDVNRSGYRFVADTLTCIVYGLGAIKGLGRGSIEAMVESRQADGEFQDLYDLCERVEQRKLNKRCIEALLGSGALDELVASKPDCPPDLVGYKRALLMANLDDALGLAGQKASNKMQGATDLFESEEQTNSEAGQRYKFFDKQHSEQLPCLSFKDRIYREKEVLGLFLTGHPIDFYQEELRHLATRRIADLSPGRDQHTIAGLILNQRKIQNRRGETMVFLTLDDKSGRIEITISGDPLTKNRDKLNNDQIILVKGNSVQDNYTGGMRFRATEVQTILEARTRKVARLRLDLDGQQLGEDFITDLADLLQPFIASSGCPIALEYSTQCARGDIILGEEWCVLPEDDLIQGLKDRYGTGQVCLEYT